jgi:hypothetical protein
VRYSDYKGQHQALLKRAFFGELIDATTELPQAVSEVLQNGTVLLLAGSGLLGGGIGYAAAKMTSHGKQDLDTVKKEYENERLKADLGYLTAKTRSEYERLNNKVAPKPARVIA